MIGKGREQTGESKKSREREEKEKRKGLVYRELYYCIIFIIIVIMIMPLPYYFHSMHIDFSFVLSHLSPFLFSFLFQASTALLYS